MMIRTAQELLPDVIARIGALVTWLLLIAAAAMSTLEPAHAQGAVPEITIVAGADVEEGEDAVFTLSRTGDTATELTVDVAVSERFSGLEIESEARLGSPGRVSSNAPNSVTFAQGASSVTLTLPTVDDTLHHPDVLVTARILDRATYTSGAASSATVTVSENDALIAQVRINAPDVVSEGENLMFGVDVAGNGIGGDVTYRITLEDGTAQTPSDFLNGHAHDQLFSVSLTILSLSLAGGERLIENPDGTNEFFNAVTGLFFFTINDGLLEGDETMVIRVEPVSTTGGLTALGATRTITIRDRKPSVTITAASSLVTEGTDALFTLSRTESTAEALTVNVTISETASKLSGSLPATVTFDAGAGEAMLALNTQGDSVVGEHSTVTVTISPDTDDPAIYRPGDPDTASVTVLDDDETARGVIVAPTELTVAEGGSGEYWVALQTAPTDTVTIAIASDDSAAATVSPASLTFTTANWDTRQKVTVTGEADTDTNDETVTLTHDVGGGDYASEGVTAPPVTVTVEDEDETPVPMVWGFLGSGGEEGNDATFRLRRTGATDAELEVNVSVSDTGEFLAEDEERNRTVTFAPGASVAQLSVPTVDDEFGEPDGTITVQIENGDAYDIGNPDTVQSTVFDDDGISSEVLLGVSPEQVGEDDPASDVTVSATLDRGARTEATNVVVAFGAATDSANRGADYEADTELTLTIAPGQTSAAGTIAVTPIDDAYGEGDETISLTGSTADLQVIGTQVTITDDEIASSEVTLMVSSSAVGEDDPATAVTVTAALDEDPRSEPTSVVVAVGATSDSATEGTDFEAIDDLTITIAAGAASATATFTLTPNDDAYGEGEETISVTGSNADLQVIGTQVTIADDETPSGEVTLETTPGAVGESDAATMITVTATLDEDPRPAPTNIALAVGGSGDTATEGTDYETIGDLAFTIPAGAASATTTFTLTPTADTDNEGEEAISVTGTTPDLTVAGTRVTIADDETATEITLEVSPSSVAENEGERAIELTVRLKGAVRSTATNVSITIGDASDSASEGVDYGTVADLSVTIGAGAPSATATFRLSPTDDTYGEGDEQISVSATASGLTVTGTQLTIADDEDAPEFTLILTPASISESGGTSIVTGTLDTPIAQALTGTLETFLDPNADPPVVVDDYVISGSLTFAAQSTQSTGTLTVTAVDNRVDTDDKLLYLEWIPDLGYVKSGEAALIIEDDDAAPVLELSVNPETIAEAGGTSTVTVSTGTGSTFATAQTIALALSGTATEMADYSITSKSLTLPAGAGSGASSVTATVTAMDDALSEGDETVLIDAALGTGGMAPAVGTSQTLTIIDDDVDEPPSAPATPMVSAVSGSTTSLSVSWAAPANAGKPAIANYDVQYRVGSSGTWSDGPQDVTGTTTTVSGLVADTLYEARVRASNAEGDSGWSEPPGSGRTNAPSNNAPVFSPANVSREIAENTAAGQDVGAAVTATDADAGDTLSYTLGGADVAAFDFVETTGQIRTKAGVSYDFEAKASYTVTVTASDNGNVNHRRRASPSASPTWTSPPARRRRPWSRQSPAAPPACRSAGPPRPTPASPPSPATTCSTAWAAPGPGAMARWTSRPRPRPLPASSRTPTTRRGCAPPTPRATPAGPSRPGPAGPTRRATMRRCSVPANVSREIAENTAAGQDVGAAVTATDADAGDTLSYTLGGADVASFDFVETTGRSAPRPASATISRPRPPTRSRSRPRTTATPPPSPMSPSASPTWTSPPVRRRRPWSRQSPAAPPACRSAGPPRPTPASPPSPATTCSTAWAAPGPGATARWTSRPRPRPLPASSRTPTTRRGCAPPTPRATPAGPSRPGPAGPTRRATMRRCSVPANVSREIAENTAAGQDVGAAVTATDADAGDNLSYMLGGADVASFDFVGTTGQIRTKAGVSYDFEAKDSYTVTVTATDNSNATAVADVTISVTDVDEPPSAPATPMVSAVSGSTTSLSVSWAAPANAGKPAIASYDVQYRVGSSGTWSDGPVDVATTSTTIASLVANTDYEARVRASNAEGDSGWSDPPGSGRTNAPSNNAPVFSSGERVPRNRGEHRRGPGRRRRGDGHRRRRRRHPQLHAGRRRHGLLRLRRDHGADPHQGRRQLRFRGQGLLHGHGHGHGQQQRHRRRRCHHQHHRRGRAPQRAGDAHGLGSLRQHHQPVGQLGRPGQRRQARHRQLRRAVPRGQLRDLERRPGGRRGHVHDHCQPRREHRLRGAGARLQRRGRLRLVRAARVRPDQRAEQQCAGVQFRRTCPAKSRRTPPRARTSAPR